jgi:ubiquinone biosynthesis protein UbiJ
MPSGLLVGAGLLGIVACFAQRSPGSTAKNLAELRSRMIRAQQAQADAYARLERLRDQADRLEKR